MGKKTEIALAVANGIILVFAALSLGLDNWHVIPIGLLCAGCIYSLLS